MACHEGVSGPPEPMLVHDVFVTLESPGHCVTTCGLPGGDEWVLTTVTVTNKGSRDAFLAECGESPRFVLERLVGNTWTPVISTILCPVSHGAIRLAPGASLGYNRYVAPGKIRFRVYVGTDSNMIDVLPAVSNELNMVLLI
jgi:hypothetical protein